MWIDLAGLAILALFIGVGYWRGAIAAGSGLACLVVGYAGGWAAARHLGGLFEGVAGMPALLAPAVAGTAGFVVAYLLCAGAGYALRRWEEDRRGEEPRSAADRCTGGLFGAMRGSLLIVLLSVLVTWLDAARDLGVMPGLTALPDSERSQIAGLSGDVVESVVGAALGGGGESPAAKVVARLVAQPGASLRSFQALADDERIEDLQKDPLFWVLVENGAGDRAIRQSSFHAIVSDPGMRRQLADLGLVGEETVADADLFRASMAKMLNELGPRLQGLRNDPEILRLARDPEISALLESGNTFALMTHPGIRQLAARVASQP